MFQKKLYEKCLSYELEKNGHQVIKQVMVPVEYDDLLIDAELRVDLLVDHIIVVELKTAEHLLPIHEAQILTFMKLLNVPQRLLINFFTDSITKSLKPFVNEYYTI